MCYFHEYFPQEDQSITESVNSFGTASWDGVDAELMPEHLGVNYIELSAPEYSEMEVGRRTFGSSAANSWFHSSMSFLWRG